MAYVSLKLPEEFITEFVDDILNNRSLGYSTRAEVIKAMIRIAHRYVEQNTLTEANLDNIDEIIKNIK